jgi:Tfp pilus assembly protein PilN
MHLPNLLPAQHKKHYKLYAALLYLRRFLAIQALVLGVLAVVFAAGQLYYAERLQDLKASVATLRDANNQFNVASLQKTADRQNAQVKAAAAVLSGRPAMSKVVGEVVRILPANVTIDSIKIETSPTRIDLKGRAASRDSIVALQARIEESELLASSYAPLSNLTESVDAPFYFVLSYDLKAIQGNE